MVPPTRFLLVDPYPSIDDSISIHTDCNDDDDASSDSSGCPSFGSGSILIHAPTEPNSEIIGIAITYGVITTLVNTTTIDVDDRELRVRHGPLPVPGNKTLPSLDVKQLYCKERISRNKNGTSVTYALHVKLKGGKDEKLLANLTQQSHALYVEQQVERVLGLQDEAVAGETI